VVVVVATNLSQNDNGDMCGTEQGKEQHFAMMNACSWQNTGDALEGMDEGDFLVPVWRYLKMAQWWPLDQQERRVN
jgi:hypothetical protein